MSKTLVLVLAAFVVLACGIEEIQELGNNDDAAAAKSAVATPEAEDDDLGEGVGRGGASLSTTGSFTLSSGTNNMSGKGGWFVVFQLCALFSLAYAEDFYKLLGISRKATNKEIKKSYRQKSLEFHPDKNKSEGAADKFAQINRAYEALMNEETRSIYDQHGEEGLKRHEDGGREVVV